MELNIINISAILVTLIGSVYDVKLRKVPNWLTFGTFFVALIANIATLEFSNVLVCIGGFFVGLALLIIPYILGGMGAGDVKLLGAIGSILGIKSVIFVFLYSTVAGSIVGFLWMLISKPGNLKFLLKTGQITPVIDKKEKVPYAVAIFIGTLLFIGFGKVPFIKI